MRLGAALLITTTTRAASSKHPRRVQKSVLVHHQSQSKHPLQSQNAQVNHRHLQQVTSTDPTFDHNPSIYEDEWWSALPPQIQQSYTILGWDEYHWDMGINPPPESLSWNELSTEMQLAAIQIGYDATLWDDPYTENDSIENYAWCGLPEFILDAAMILGWDEELWDGNGNAWSDYVYWVDLTTREKKAAIVLGYGEKDWDESVEALLAEEASAASSGAVTTEIVQDAEVIASETVVTVEAGDIGASEEAFLGQVELEMSLPKLVVSMSEPILEPEVLSNETEMSMQAEMSVSLSVPEMSLSQPFEDAEPTYIPAIEEDELMVTSMSLSEMESSMSFSVVELGIVSITTEATQSTISVQTTEVSSSSEVSMAMPELDVPLTYVEFIELSMSMTEMSLPENHDSYNEESLSMLDSNILWGATDQNAVTLSVSGDANDDSAGGAMSSATSDEGTLRVNSQVKDDNSSSTTFRYSLTAAFTTAVMIFV